MLPVVLLVLLMVCSAVAGYAYAQRAAREAATAAAAAGAVCDDQLRSKAAALDELRQRLADLAQRHRDAMTAAEIALDGRDAQIKTLLADQASRALAIERMADEDDDVAALRRMGVPGVLAEQLWPAPRAADSAAAH